MRTHLRKLLADPPGSAPDNAARPDTRDDRGATVIPTLIPPQAPLEQLIRGPLPKSAEPEPAPIDDILCGVCALGEVGRVLDRYVMTALN